MTAHLKPLMLKAVAGAHLALSRKSLPDNVAIYFHELEQWQLPRLEEALSWFADEGYRTVDARDFAAQGRAGEKRLFVSFDDNFLGWHRALPLFDRRDARVTFYLNTAPIRDIAEPGAITAFFARICYGGEDATLSRAEIRELHAAGHTIGCHTHSHPMLSALPRGHWDEEILGCKKKLEELIGAPVRDFSFPFGMKRHFSAELRDYCAAAGFETVATGISGMQYASPRDLLDLHRTSWDFSGSLADNLARLRVHAPWYGGVLGRSAVG